jgi:hypothetical protein
MPNWCNNHITLQHDDPTMIKRAYDALERGEFLQEFIPVPKDLSETVSGFLGNGDEQKALEAKTQANIEKYGYGNWYDYCVGEWGTKWDTGEQGNNDINPNDPKMLTAGFDTAWAPPIAAYEKLMDLGFTVKAMYFEPGMCFAGIWEDGHDDCYQDWGDSQGAKDTLPVELDDMFGISESQAEYEAENEEEELTEWLKDGIEQKKALITL